MNYFERARQIEDFRFHEIENYVDLLSIENAPNLVEFLCLQFSLSVAECKHLKSICSTSNNRLIIDYLKSVFEELEEEVLMLVVFFDSYSKNPKTPEVSILLDESIFSHPIWKDYIYIILTFLIYVEEIKQEKIESKIKEIYKHNKTNPELLLCLLAMNLNSGIEKDLSYLKKIKNNDHESGLAEFIYFELITDNYMMRSATSKSIKYLSVEIGTSHPLVIELMAKYYLQEIGLTDAFFECENIVGSIREGLEEEYFINQDRIQNFAISMGLFNAFLPTKQYPKYRPYLYSSSKVDILLMYFAANNQQLQSSEFNFKTIFYPFLVESDISELSQNLLEEVAGVLEHSFYNPKNLKIIDDSILHFNAFIFLIVYANYTLENKDNMVSIMQNMNKIPITNALFSSNYLEMFKKINEPALAYNVFKRYDLEKLLSV